MNLSLISVSNTTKTLKTLNCDELCFFLLTIPFRYLIYSFFYIEFESKYWSKQKNLLYFYIITIGVLTHWFSFN